MSELQALNSFFLAIRDDCRIGTSHISVYMALFHFYSLNEFQNPVRITRAEVMKQAKIGGLATYHRCVKDLAELGYIKYQPSFNPAVGSLVWML